MKKLACLVLTLYSGLALGNTVTDYDFPTISQPYNKYEATVIGTLPQAKAELPEEIPFHTESIKIFEDREIPESLFFDEELRYSQALQGDKAPLVFLIAGTGASHNGGKNVGMAKAYYQAGYHVVSLSSPTFMNFVVAGSSTSVPGHAVKDAEDLYHVMEKIWGVLKDDIDVSDFYVTGYSLGAFNTAFVTKLDEDRKVFNFKKALMINPPVSLYNSISLLDRMADNIPGGADNLHQFLNELLEEVGRVYRDAPSVEMNEEFLFQAYQAVKPGTEELAALVGLSFRMSSANMVYASDLMTRYGFIVPSNVKILQNSNQIDYMLMAHQLGFTDYYHAYFYPFHTKGDDQVKKQDYTDRMSLYAIEDYLKTSQKIELIHNVDDIILEPNEIDFFPRVFGDRAKIYPKGGHCGNMLHRDNVNHMISVFSE